MNCEPIRFAYADPPYPGKARKYYGDHGDYAGEVDHAALIERLEDEFPDGWALSTSQNALRQVLPLCPAPISRGARGGGVRHQIRVLAWCKTSAQAGSPLGTAPAALFGWEPVIIRGGRPASAGAPRPRDWLVCPIEMYTLRPKPDGHVTGAKPPAFCRWLFECAGLQPHDELVDLFPGSGAVAAEWRAWSRQPGLFGAAA
jgi:hypothetical protein